MGADMGAVGSVGQIDGGGRCGLQREGDVVFVRPPRGEEKHVTLRVGALELLRQAGGGGAAVAATAITKDEQADVASSSRDSKQVPGAPTPRARPGLGSGRVREK